MIELLASLADLRRIIEQAKLTEAQQEETKAPWFTPLEFVRMDEQSMSRIIAWLLDPHGSHSQGLVFLRLFLDAVGMRNLETSGGARVLVEFPTSSLPSHRRIDILVEDSSWSVALENKPWAHDQDLQVFDYLKEVGHRAGHNGYLLYLTPQGTLPAKNSLSREECEKEIKRGTLKLHAYSTLLLWLGTCRKMARAERVSSFIADFIQKIRHHVLHESNPERSSMIIDSLLSNDNRAHLPLILEIAQSKDALHIELLRRMRSSLGQELSGWHIAGDITKKDDGLTIAPPQQPGWVFCVEVGEEGTFAYGIKNASNLNRTERLQLTAKLTRALPRSDGSSDIWPIWFHFKDRTPYDPSIYSRWDESVQPWLNMADGNMARNLAKLAAELCEAGLT